MLLLPGVPAVLFVVFEAALTPDRARLILGVTLVPFVTAAVAWLLSDRFIVAPVARVIRREHEAAVLQAEVARSLREADEMKSTFLDVASHDLGNPVTIIRGFTEILVHSGHSLSDAERTDMLRRIYAASGRMGRLLQGIMDVERLHLGLLRPERKPTDVVDLARRIVAEQEVTDHIVRVDGDAEPVNIDRGQVECIVENLLRNAVKYSPVGSEVHVQVSRRDNGVLIAVHDRGVGVPDDQKELIFERFQRGDSNGHSGMGVGLHIVERFAVLHGGRAWVENRPDAGSSFKVFLPEETP